MIVMIQWLRKRASVPHDSCLLNKKCEDYPQQPYNNKHEKIRQKQIENWYIWRITLQVIIVIKAPNFLYFLFL